MYVCMYVCMYCMYVYVIIWESFIICMSNRMSRLVTIVLQKY